MTDSVQTEAPFFRGRFWQGFLAATFAAGFAMRLLGAWWFADSGSPDHSVPCLMAKHIARGQDFPVFFYGQPYMGSLEPLISSAFVRLLGPTGFACNLGTALLGCVFLALVWAWTRRAAGPVAGWAALAFCAVGPPAFFQFSSWAYGGYAAIMALSAGIILLTDHIVDQERKAGHAPVRSYVAAGLVAGIGWWTSPLLAAPFLVCALLVLCARPQILWTPRAWAALPAFLLASAPFWIWNASHGWATLRFAESQQATGFLWRLRVCYAWFLPGIAGCDQPRWLGLVFLALAAVFVWATLSETRRRLRDAPFRARVSAVALLAVVPLLVSLTLYRNERYLFSLVAPVALIAGVATDWLRRRIPWGLGWVPLAGLIFVQGMAFPTYRAWRQQDLRQAGRVQTLAAVLRDRGIRHVFAPYRSAQPGFALNHLLNEEFVFAGPFPLYPPYDRDFEAADRPAVLDHFGNPQAFLASCGGTSEVLRAGGFLLHHDFAAPTGTVALLPPDRIRRIRADDGTDPTSDLSDEHALTGWSCVLPDGAVRGITVRLDEPRTICGLEIYSHTAAYPDACRIEVRDSADGPWRNLGPTFARTDFFWSGPRPVLGDHAYRWRVRFENVEAAAVRVKVSVAGGGSRPVEISELGILEATQPAASEWDAGVERMATLLGERGIARVYADRWLSNRLALRNPRMRTFCAPELLRPSQRLEALVELTPDTALVVEKGFAPACRRILADRRVTCRETECGPWTVLDVGGDAWQESYRLGRGLIWTGTRCLERDIRTWGASLLSLSKESAAAGRLKEAWDLTDAALRVYPDCREGLRFGAELLARLDRNEESSILRERARSLWVPSSPGPLEFAEDLRLLGVTVRTQSVAEAGLTLDLSYFWRCGPQRQPEMLAVFSHFRDPDGRILAQDDHVLLEKANVSDQPLEHVFVQRRTVSLTGLPPGRAVDLWVGLYGRTPPYRRVAVRTELPCERNAVRIARVR